MTEISHVFMCETKIHIMFMAYNHIEIKKIWLQNRTLHKSFCKSSCLTYTTMQAICGIQQNSACIFSASNIRKELVLDWLRYAENKWESQKMSEPVKLTNWY